MAKRGAAIATRKLTICNKGFVRCTGRYVFFPAISLSGKWLADQGFRSGHVIDVACEKNRLTITIARNNASKGFDNLPAGSAGSIK